MKGLEPLPLSEPDPKSGASTNSATPAGLPSTGKDKKRGYPKGSPFCIGWNVGFEPTTHGTTIRYSNQLS